MNVDVIDSEQRGITENEWLLSKHTYSFGGYHNLKRLNFGTLRVFNDDVVKPGKGFGTHRHDNMEIVTIVLKGALEHKDSAGNHGIIRPGEVQRMTAGRGIQHSEFNASKEEDVRFLQVWVYPEKRDLEPSYQQKRVDMESTRNQLSPVVMKNAGEKQVAIHQDATFYLGTFEAGKQFTHKLPSKSHGIYAFVIDGRVKIGDSLLKSGDSAQITDTEIVEATSINESLVLFIEVSVNTL